MLIFLLFINLGITTSDQSIFDYQNGKTHSDFSFPDFVPQFLDEADEEVVQNATNHCGEENLECIFDLVFTGREDVADDTKLTDIQHSETVLINGMLPNHDSIQ